ncbi:MAG: hypothetical protein ACYTHJ_08460 [Planctomycetota bacterium]
MSEPPYHIEIEGVDDEDGGGGHPPGFAGRPWVGIRFDCCHVYTRVYRNNEGTAYQGSCPHCGRRIRLRVGSDGTSARFFRAD